MGDYQDYKIWNPKNNKKMLSRDVEFDERLRPKYFQSEEGQRFSERRGLLKKKILSESC